MDIELVVKEYRPRLTSFLQTKRSAEDARVFAADCRDNIDDKERMMPLLFSIMSADADHKATYAEVSSVARKLTIGILRHPHNDYDLQAVLASYVEKMKVFCAKNLGRSINQTCEQLDVKFWTTMWQDMEEGYFDGFMKHILILRIEMLQQSNGGNGGDGKKYSTSTILQFFDMEYIKKNMYLKTYHFMSVFEFVRGFINDKIHDVLKPSFNAMCDNFVAETPATTTNETHVRVLRFLIKHMIDYLYLDVSAAF